jgi:hypothetical protein
MPVTISSRVAVLMVLAMSAPAFAKTKLNRQPTSWRRDDVISPRNSAATSSLDFTHQRGVWRPPRQNLQD